ncbi:MAG: hypothetical protein L3K09_00385 [Thermoplasmata archaeon]|nr:hypothetical protein [Thermoplasmata archaeon]
MRFTIEQPGPFLGVPILIVFLLTVGGCLSGLSGSPSHARVASIQGTTLSHSGGSTYLRTPLPDSGASYEVLAFGFPHLARPAPLPAAHPVVAPSPRDRASSPLLEMIGAVLLSPEFLELTAAHGPQNFSLAVSGGTGIAPWFASVTVRWDSWVSGREITHWVSWTGTSADARMAGPFALSGSTIDQGPVGNSSGTHAVFGLSWIVMLPVLLTLTAVLVAWSVAFLFAPPLEEERLLRRPDPGTRKSP